MSPTLQITFLLNDELITTQVIPGMVALDYLRKVRQLTGSKEGCKEGDCGACTVIVGELQGDTVNYRPMTSCLLPMGELHGKHLVSIEGLNMEKLSPVQEAIHDCGGTQCGYCTPGFVVAMTAGLMDESIPLSKEGMDYAMSGNLCRCTGYRSIKAAGKQAIDKLAPLVKGQARIPALCEASALPSTFLEAADKLKSIPPIPDKPSGDSTPIVAGGTDLFVQRGEELPDSSPLLLNKSQAKATVDLGEELSLDARMTFESFARDPLVLANYPSVANYNPLMASWPIRTRATLAGNICNASPIADMTCLLLALEANLIIETSDGDECIALKDFYLGYKKLAKEASDLVKEIRIPKASGETHLNWEKVSKRRILDIATVNSAAKFEIVAGVIKSASLALGGVAATPLYLEKTSASLSGKELSPDLVRDALATAQTEFNPISDVRGSADYKRLLARQLLAAHFTTLFPETINSEELYASLR
ncbi:FAD binding domain-containing protein [Pelagicoccus albus]|uniref:FAD binding domain-containing protein n=1 Tax=Pelagicoccus albus TaxID=415222 RepID=A0A7X1E778_9BACT|nr:FAD binding domain-containing protein [Pelagicoccus albus]MBC2605450.1 FAD binding domain-containing protein [Pelagicoccus albus]